MTLDNTLELLTLNKLFKNGERQFFVPDYQRGYSWEEEHRADLIDDIEQIQHQIHKHYTGTVVASCQDGSSRYDIVDGQQRITTLVLLLSSIVRLARLKGVKELGGVLVDDVEAVYIRNGGNSGNSSYSLELGQVRDPLFREVLSHGDNINQKIQSKADQNIIDAAKQFDIWLSKKSKESLTLVFQAVTSKLGFLMYAPAQDAEIGLMFEVINNRGKPLSELEKIKNYLIYFASRHQIGDLKEKVNSSWPVLLQALNIAGYTSNEAENRFLRVCWIVFEDYNKSRSHHVYDNIKIRYSPKNPEHWQSLSKFVDFIVGSARAYANLYNVSQSTLSPKENRNLQRIAFHPGHASILPLLIAISTKEMNEDKRAIMFELLEKLNFRYYVSGIANRSDTGQGDLFWFAYHYYHGTLSEQYEGEWPCELDLLRERLVNFISERANDHKLVQYLTLDKDESGDYYGWRGLKFFLASYEDSLLECERKGSKLTQYLASRDKVHTNDFYHLEHIWAAKDFEVVNDADDRNVNKRRLGNFILLMETLNIRVSNDRPEIKVEGYFKYEKIQPNTMMIRELRKDFIEAQKLVDATGAYVRKVPGYWYQVYQTFLDVREQRMVNFALQRWNIDGIYKPVTMVVIDSNTTSNEIFKCQPEHSKTKTVDDIHN